MTQCNPLVKARYLYLDTETTGLHPTEDDLVEVALVDDEGNRILDELCRPAESWMRRGWPDAQDIHGIGRAAVADARPADAVRRDIAELVRDQDLVIYNARFDAPFFLAAGPCELPARTIQCAMLAAEDFFRWYKWPKLIEAAAWVGHDWRATGIPPHRAAGDALASRTVWRYMVANGWRGGPFYDQR